MPSSTGRLPNPYDFVPFEGAPTYLDRLPSIARYSGLTGSIDFTLDALTPLCILLQPPPKRDQRKPGDVYHFMRLADQPFIPASSLKGMLRSVHEVVTNSTMGKLTPNAGYLRQIPHAYQPGTNPDHLTPSEALFGMTPANGDESTASWAGRLFFDDMPIPTRPRTRLGETHVPRPDGGKPDPKHRPFYFTPGGEALGRKFYYHQDPTSIAAVYDQRGMPNIIVETLKGSLPGGHVRFVNLAQEELEALVYTLVLEDGLAHKLGYSKPFGLGTVRLTINGLFIERHTDGVPSRFLSYDGAEAAPPDWTQQIPTLRDKAKSAWLARQDGQGTYEALSTILRWPQSELFAYPERGTFGSTPLWQWQGRSTVYPTQSRPEPPQPAKVEPSSGEVGQDVIQSSDNPFENWQTGRLMRDDEPYLPFVQLKDKRYRLDDESGPQEIVQDLRMRLMRGEQPRIKFRPDEVAIVTVVGRGKQKKTRRSKMNVLRNVTPLPGQTA